LVRFAMPQFNFWHDADYRNIPFYHRSRARLDTDGLGARIVDRSCRAVDCIRLWHWLVLLLAIPDRHMAR